MRTEHAVSEYARIFTPGIRACFGGRTSVSGHRRLPSDGHRVPAGGRTERGQVPNPMSDPFSARRHRHSWQLAPAAVPLGWAWILPPRPRRRRIRPWDISQ